MQIQRSANIFVFTKYNMQNTICQRLHIIAIFAFGNLSSKGVCFFTEITGLVEKELPL